MRFSKVKYSLQIAQLISYRITKQDFSNSKPYALVPLLKAVPGGEVNNSEGQHAGRFHKVGAISAWTILPMVCRQCKTMLFLRILDTYNVSMNPCLYLVSWFFLLQEGIVTRIIRNKTQSTSLLCLHVGNNSNSIYLLIMLAKAIKMNLQSAAQKIDDRNWPRAAESPNDSSFNLKYVVGNRPSG